LNPNGKIDRSALRARIATEMDPVPIERKRTTTEVVVGAFVAEALGVDKVSLDDDFFILGGHSLMAIQVVTRINETFGTRFDLSIFSGEQATVAGLSALVAEVVRRPAASAVPIHDSR